MKINRFVLPLGIFVALVVVLALGVKRSPEHGIIKSVLIGKPAPEFDLPSLTDPNRRVSSRTLLGKPYVLNVWGTWCYACRIEHKSLLQIQQMAQVPIIGLNWRDESADALAWLAQLGNPYAQIAVDRDGRTAIDWGVYGAPETFLVNAKGIIVHKHIGPLSVEIWKRDFVPLLSGKPVDAT